MRSFIIEFNELDDNELQVVFKVKKDLIYQSLLLNMIQAMADIVELARSYYGADLEEEYDYYDDFTQRVDDAKTISEAKGLIEFEIKGDEII